MILMNRNNKLIEKFRIINAIYNFEEECKQENNKRIEKYTFKEKIWRKYTMKKGVVATIVVSAFMGCSVVMATSYVVYEKVWKEPTIISNEQFEKEQKEAEKRVKEDIKDEEKISFVDENVALQKAREILNILGYEDIELKYIDTIRDYGDNIKYKISTSNEVGNGLLLQIDSKTGELEYFCDNDIGKQQIEYDNITEKQAKDIAEITYKNLGIIKENDSYEIIKVSKQAHAINNNIVDMWEVSFAERYNNLIDKNNMFTTCFVVVDGRNLFSIIKGKTNKAFDGNEVIISEDEAKNIAIAKEKEFSSLEISEVNAELSIEKMNSFVYYMENNIEDTDNIYKVQDISRVVWVVEIKHNKSENVGDANLKTVKELYNKKYYVDSTTGEIIGGKQAELFNN